MAEVKSLSTIQEKYTRVTPQRSDDYKKGVENPRRDWEKSAKSAEDSYKTAVTDAANKGRYGKGVTEAGTEKWKEKTLEKGPGRFTEGTSAAGADYADGVSKYIDTISKTTLPPRYPTGDPRNIERVKTIDTALRKAKTG